MWAFFISIWIPLTAPVNTTRSFGNKFCTGIYTLYNDHDQIMNSNIPNETLPLPYAPLLILIYISIIILTVAIWFRQFKNSAVEPLAPISPISHYVQRPKDMECMLANFSFVILITINSVVSLIWRKYEIIKLSESVIF